ncbi:unnamed protein product [Urochloa decumbens]|uniref:F-box protein n=1 Tax=Urochloa decumbens TaxID=240449 RepID=A0ABC9G2C3_9POAL
MQLRSGRHLVTPQQGGARRRGRPRRRITDDGDGVDRISGLPDELLLDVLALLGCVLEAARTSVLARGWRRLWTRLPGNLNFSVADPADPVNGARAKFHRNDRGLFISVGAKIPAPSLTSVLRVAAQIEPAGLQLMMLIRDGLPCFERAAWIEMSIYDQLNFTLPPAGVFASLEYLNLWICTADVAGLLARCPRLRHLKLFGSWRVNTLAIHSASLEELMLGILEKGDYRTLRHVDIVTPVLKKFERQWCGPEEFTISYSMPVVEEISILHYGPSSPVGLGQKWRLESLTMGTACVNKHEQPVRALSLEILCDALKCSENCDCNQVGDRRNQHISLTDLEVAVIEGFRGVYHEINFLKLLFRYAPMLKKMTVHLSIEVSRYKELFRELQAIFQGNASMECNVYDKCGKKILFA